MALGSGTGPGNEVSWSDEVARADAEKLVSPGTNKKSFASVLGSNLPVRDNKNVLEVVLEKDSKGSFIVTEKECAI